MNELKIELMNEILEFIRTFREINKDDSVPYRAVSMRFLRRFDALGLNLLDALRSDSRLVVLPSPRKTGFVLRVNDRSVALSDRIRSYLSAGAITVTELKARLSGQRIAITEFMDTMSGLLASGVIKIEGERIELARSRED